MTDRDPRLGRLLRLAHLVHEARMARLSAALSAQEAARSKLRELDPRPIDLDDIGSLQAQLRHQAWAARRRHRLEQEITEAEITLARLRKDASRSLARSLVLTRLSTPGRRDQPS